MKRFTVRLVLSLLAGSTLMAANASAEDAPLTPAQVEAIVKKVIQDNPELIIKSVEDYQLKQQAAAVSHAAQNIVAKQSQLQHDPNSPSIGNPKGDVTIVEFFDYHCGYCKHFFPILTQLMDEDKNVRIVFKEFPILSEDSELAAKAALAVYTIDNSKYFAYHTALMKSGGRFTMDMLANKAEGVGISAEEFKKAMSNPALTKEIERNKDLAQSLNISGTPVIIVGNELIPGAIEFSTLKEKVAQARTAQKEHK